MEKQAVIFLMGPTGCGKTDMAIALSERLPGEIVSVDSALIYRGLDVGTAKPADELRARVPHHLIDILDPSQCYSVARFRQDALDCIEHIHARQKIPILAGGTMFYFHALSEGLDQVPPVPEPIRQKLDRIESRRGVQHLYKVLGRVDAAMSASIHPNDSQRIKRALSVFFACGMPLSQLQTGQRTCKPCPYPIYKYSLNYKDRRILHRRLEVRLDKMLATSRFMQECMDLMLTPGIPGNAPALRLIGYVQMCAYLRGELNFASMREQALYATRQLAKRQITWMRSMQGIRQFYLDEQSFEAIADTVAHSLQ